MVARSSGTQGGCIASSRRSQGPWRCLWERVVAGGSCTPKPIRLGKAGMEHRRNHHCITQQTTRAAMWVIPIQKTLFPPSPGMRFWLVPITLLPAGIHPVLLCPRGFR